MFRKIDQLEQEAIIREKETAVVEAVVEPQQTALDVVSSPTTDSKYGLNLADLIARDARTDWRKLNETTPQRGTVIAPPAQPPHSSSKRKLFDGIIASTTAKKRFRLVDVYERLFDTLPEQSHYAEADTFALLRCVCAAREPFLAIIDAESRPWTDVKPLGK